MTARWFHNRHAAISDMPSQIPGRGDSIPQIIRVEHFFESGGDSIEIATCKSAVRGKSLGQNEEIGFELSDTIVIRAQESADVGEGVLLRGECAAIGQRKHLLRDLLR